jgi:hypothetical protein
MSIRSRGCPRNCKRRAERHYATGLALGRLGRRRKATTREPGDLPSGEQQITILLPNPFLSADGDKILKQPDWSRLAVWDELRRRWLGLADPDPVDRSGRAFRHA